MPRPRCFLCHEPRFRGLELIQPEIRFRCQHVFHKACMARYYFNHGYFTRCPTCNRVITRQYRFQLMEFMEEIEHESDSGYESS